MSEGNHLLDTLRAAARAQPDAVFAETPDATIITHGEIFARAEQIAAALVEAGVKPGDRVAAQVEKSVAALALYLGTIMAGAAFLPLNTAYTDSEVQYFLDDAEPTVFVVDPQRRKALSAVAAASGVPGLFDLDAAGHGSLTDAADAHAPGFATVPRDADDLAAILYTSGTTGRAKGAMLTHGNLVSNARALCETWRFTAADRLIHALPIFHTHGLFVATNVTLTAGSALLFFPRFDAEAILAAMPRATVMMGVPTFYTRLVEAEDLADAASAMRLFVSGSAPLLAETHRRWHARTGHAILERYGMTETNMIASNPYDGERRPGAVGMPLPDVAVRIADNDGHSLPSGEPGIIEVRGPNVFKGYWRMPEKTREEFRPDGWFITGDIGRIDADGYLSIVGRAKDLIISGGFNVYPKEVEAVIDDQPGVDESAVIGLPHADFGEAVTAIVVAQPGATSEAALLDMIRPHLARFKQPKRILFVDALPRNTMGKVQKAALREEHRNLFNPAAA